MSLREKAESMNAGVKVEFMKGRESGKTSEILGKKYTIRDYAFLKDDKDEEYAVFILDEIKDKFFFGGSVLTKNLKEFTDEEKAEIQEKGLPVLLREQKSKTTKRTYTAVIFFPAEDDLPF